MLKYICYFTSTLVFTTLPLCSQTLPKAGVELSGIDPGNANYAFVDLMKQSGPWTSGTEPTGTAIPAANQDANGYITSFPAGVTFAAVRLAYDNKEFYGTGSDSRVNNGTTPAGQYCVKWDGSGKVYLLERTRSIDNPGSRCALVTGGDYERRKVYQVTAGTELKVVVTTLNGGFARGIRVWLPNSDGTLRESSSSPFNPVWLSLLQGASGPRFGVIRFMNWNRTNNSPQTDWNSRKPVSYRTYSGDGINAGGVPYEIMMDLCNQLDCDMWVCIPHQATISGATGHVEQLANLVSTRLESARKVWVEYTNEHWNGSFSQKSWIGANVPPPSSGTSTFHKYGKRAAEVWARMETVLGDARVNAVLCGQATNSGVLSQAAQGAEDRTTPAPATKVELMAISHYFGHDLGQYILTNNLHTAADQTAAKTQAFDRLNTLMDSTLNSIFGSFGDYPTATAWGVPLVSYEGGQHVISAASNDAVLNNFIWNLQDDSRMGTATNRMLTQWTIRGGKTPSSFVECNRWAPWSCFGHKRTLSHNSAKWNSLVTWIGL